MTSKENVEFIESILSIIVSLITIFGSIISIPSGFWVKLVAWLEKEL